MFDSYLKLERNAAMERAINRCRKTRLKAHTVSIDARLYTVPSRTQAGKEYVVKFNVAKGERFAACTCEAGKRSMMCSHIAVAYVQHTINMAMRQQAEKLAASLHVDGAASEPGEGSSPSPRQPTDDAPEGEGAALSSPDYPIQESHDVETFCAVCGAETGGDRCSIDVTAEILTRRERDERDRENSVLVKQPLAGDVKFGGYSI